MERYRLKIKRVNEPYELTNVTFNESVAKAERIRLLKQADIVNVELSKVN